jgi:hypothetical protein
MRNSKISSIAILAIIVSMLMASMMRSDRTQAATSAAPQSACDVFVTGVSGTTEAFILTGSGTSSLGITSLGDQNCIALQSVVVGSAVNSVVTVSPFTPGTSTSVNITAGAINPNLAATFAVTVSNQCHTITINAVVHCPSPPVGCTFTQGYWKNHPEAWPVQSLTLGTVTYTKAQLISILKTPVKGNGLISLSYQLIAAKLNQASGASVPPDVAAAIAASDALIGGLVVPPVGSGSLSTASTSTLGTTLDNYNNGLAAGGPSHCE